MRLIEIPTKALEEEVAYLQRTRTAFAYGAIAALQWLLKHGRSPSAMIHARDERPADRRTH